MFDNSKECMYKYGYVYSMCSTCICMGVCVCLSVHTHAPMRMCWPYTQFQPVQNSTCTGPYVT